MLDMFKNLMNGSQSKINPKEINSEADGMKLIAQNLKQFFAKSKQPFIRPSDNINKANAPVPNVFRSLVDFLGSTMNMSANPKAYKMWEQTRGLDQMMFALSFISDLIQAIAGPKVSEKISPLFNGLLGMLNFQKNSALDAFVSNGHATQQDRDDLVKSQKSGCEGTYELLGQLGSKLKETFKNEDKINALRDKRILKPSQFERFKSHTSNHQSEKSRPSRKMRIV